MKKLKLILPMMAFIMAVGLSFAYGNDDSSAQSGYVYDGNLWHAVGDICRGGTYTCKVQFVDEFENPVSDVLDVYPIPEFEDDNGDPIAPLKSGTPDVVKIELSK